MCVWVRARTCTSKSMGQSSVEKWGIGEGKQGASEKRSEWPRKRPAAHTEERNESTCVSRQFADTGTVRSAAPATELSRVLKYGRAGGVTASEELCMTAYACVTGGCNYV